MALVHATHALAEGAAGPATLGVATAGLVIVTEAPIPTRHIIHQPPGRAHGQQGSGLGAVSHLLAGSCLQVAGVARWAAVLPVLTAHGMGQLAAGPAPAQAGTAGLANWAAGVLVTADVANVRQGRQVGSCFLQPRSEVAASVAR